MFACVKLATTILGCWWWFVCSCFYVVSSCVEWKESCTLQSLWSSFIVMWKYCRMNYVLKLILTVRDLIMRQREREREREAPWERPTFLPIDTQIKITQNQQGQNTRMSKQNRPACACVCVCDTWASTRDMYRARQVCVCVCVWCVQVVFWAF